MEPYSVIIIGGGPAGLFCSLLLARGGLSVLLLEKMNKCGRKLLISGSGQCNLTHTGSIVSFGVHYGDHGTFIRSALMHFTNHDLIQFFEEKGIRFTEDKGGKFFPESGKAGDILDVLLNEAAGAGVRIQTGEPVLELKDSSVGFSVKTNKAEYTGSRVVIATGGYTYPVTGSDGDGYAFARGLGLTVNEPGPALVPVHIRQFPLRDLSGISFESVPLILIRDKKKIRETRGDILLTHRGLSGPGILDLSRYIRQGDELRVSFIQYRNSAAIRDELTRYFTGGGTKTIKRMLIDLQLPERFVKKIMELSIVPADMTCAQFSKSLRITLLSNLLEYPFPDIILGGTDEAMVTRGGVSLDEIIQNSMESKRIPGLYCIGELLDIDGDCGGYNLQAAFSTASLAAGSIQKKNRSE